MIKKLCLAVSLIMCLFMFSVTAAESEKPNLNLGDEFYVYSEDTDTVCEILQSDKQTLDKYLTGKKIIFLAVNGDNSKQIRISEFEDVFSKSVKNISTLKDSELKKLIPDIIGTEKLEGEIVKNKEQKYIKTEYEPNGDSGKFYLTQYNTVANGKNYVLSFLTITEPEKEYIDKHFNSFANSDVFKSISKNNTQGILLIIGIVLISLIAVAIIITIIKDTVILKKQKTNEDIEEKSEDS